jgi:hypothetical protein
MQVPVERFCQLISSVVASVGGGQVGGTETGEEEGQEQVQNLYLIDLQVNFLVFKLCLHCYEKKYILHIYICTADRYKSYYIILLRSAAVLCISRQRITYYMVTNRHRLQLLLRYGMVITRLLIEAAYSYNKQGDLARVVNFVRLTYHKVTYRRRLLITGRLIYHKVTFRCRLLIIRRVTYHKVCLLAQVNNNKKGIAYHKVIYRRILLITKSG